MQLKLIAVGKLREAFYRAGVDEYIGRIQHFLPFSQLEVQPGTGEDSNGKGQGALRREAETISKHLSGDACVVLCDVGGKALTTEQFSDWLQQQMNASVSQIVFVVGGAWGTADELRQRADLRLSLSAMTLPHELARLVLVEQIYRALTLWRGLPYHK